MLIDYSVHCECGATHGTDDPANTPEAAIYHALQDGWGLCGSEMLCPDCLEECERTDVVTMAKEADTDDQITQT